MELTEEQFARIKNSLPVQRGNVRLSNLQVLNAILYVAEQGCKWRGLPKRFGSWHTIYMRMNRWAKNGVLDRVFEQLQAEQLVRLRVEAFSLDSTSVKVHPDGTGALKKTDPNASANPAVDGTPKFIWSPRMLERRYSLLCLPAMTTMRPTGGRCWKSEARCRTAFRCSWIVLTKVMKRGNWCSNWVWFRWFRRSLTDSLRGSTTAPFTKSVMQSNASSAD